MSCICVQKAFFALKCSDVPVDVFIGATCSTHEKGTQSSSAQDVCVSLTLCPDFAVSESEDISKWPVVFHGTDVSFVNSILTHGMLLMAGDSMQNGTVINARHAIQDEESAVWTYPKPDGAKIAAGIGTFDNGQTEFQILVRLRQQPGTYKLHKKGGFGYDIWSTKRRGTLFIEGLDVFVFKSSGTVVPSPFTNIPQKSYISKFDCPVQQQAFNVLKMLKLPEGIFNMAHNRCYCSSCYPVTWPDSMDVGGEKYAIPRGWARFGLATNPVFAKLNNIWKSWHIAFHGCHPSNVISIIKSRSLLIPHDILPNGNELGVFSSTDKQQKYYFLSPEIGYSAHPWYAKPVPFTDKDGRRKYFQTVLVFKVKPGSYDKKEETEGGEMKMFDNYSIIASDEMEWYSSKRGCTHPYGLLIRELNVSNLRELNEYFHLSDDSPFKQTNEFSLQSGQKSFITSFLNFAFKSAGITG